MTQPAPVSIRVIAVVGFVLAILYFCWGLAQNEIIASLTVAIPLALLSAGLFFLKEWIRTLMMMFAGMSLTFYLLCLIFVMFSYVGWFGEVKTAIGLLIQMTLLGLPLAIWCGAVFFFLDKPEIED